MRNLLVIFFLFSLPANATSPAYPVKAKNPDCQLELEALDDKYTSELLMIYPDVEIHLIANNLMLIRKTAISEGAIETQRQIDSMIVTQLIETIKNESKSKHFILALTNIRDELSITPLLVADSQKDELSLLFKRLGI
jgi:hypothetical protein